MKEETLFRIQAELKRAREKFPNPNKNFAALVEEVGEVAKDLLEGKDSYVDEAIQVAVMAIRLAEEGDPHLFKIKDTGFKDKNGQRIFDGDFIGCEDFKGRPLGGVVQEIGGEWAFIDYDWHNDFAITPKLSDWAHRLEK